MASNTYIQLKYANIANEVGFDVVVSDNYDEAPAEFLKHDALPQDPLALAAWCMQHGAMADILQAAIDNGELIDSSWGDVSGSKLAQRLAQLRAEDEQQALDAATAEVTAASKAPRL